MIRERQVLRRYEVLVSGAFPQSSLEQVRLMRGEQS